jgi:hypothetical protein
MHSYYVSANFLLILSQRIKFVEKYLDDHEIFASCRPMFPAVGLRFNCRWALCSAFYMAKRLIDTLLGVTNFRRAPGGRSHTGCKSSQGIDALAGVYISGASYGRISQLWWNIEPMR